MLAQQVQELAAAAADVEDVGGAAEDRDVGLQAAADLVARAAEAILEADVFPGSEAAVRGTVHGRRWSLARRSRLARRGVGRRGEGGRTCRPNPLDLALERDRRLVQHGDGVAELPARLGLRRADRRRLGVEALLARDHRLPALEDLVGQAGDGAVERDVAIADVAGELEVLAVDEAGELLEVDDQRRMEGAQLAERVAGEAQRRVDGLAAGAIDRHAAVDVIDERGVERLLPLERRRDGAPGQAGDLALQPVAGDGRRLRHDAPALVERRDLRLVGRRRRMRRLAHREQGGVDGGERLVVARVGVGARLGQHGDRVVGRQRRREDARDRVGQLGHRPMTPVSGLLAVA